MRDFSRQITVAQIVPREGCRFPRFPDKASSDEEKDHDRRSESQVVQKEDRQDRSVEKNYECKAGKGNGNGDEVERFFQKIIFCHGFFLLCFL